MNDGRMSDGKMNDGRMNDGGGRKWPEVHTTEDDQ